MTSLFDQKTHVPGTILKKKHYIYNIVTPPLTVTKLKGRLRTLPEKGFPPILNTYYTYLSSKKWYNCNILAILALFLFKKKSVLELFFDDVYMFCPLNTKE